MPCWVAVSGLDRVRLQLDQVRDAVNVIDPVFLDTPALPCAPLGQVLGCSVTLKVETLNPVRSFKGRGTETVAAVARRKGTSRVVCASAGVGSAFGRNLQRLAEVKKAYDPDNFFNRNDNITPAR